MRKYRGRKLNYTIGENRWIYGFYGEGKDVNDGSIFSVIYVDKYNYFSCGSGMSESYCFVPTCERVEKQSVGQYSGVIDKNRVEMYEGDIVYGAAHWLERYKPAVVTFRNGSFGLLWHRGNVEEFNPFTSMCNVEYEVVGNIFDNPELMEGE